MRFDWRNAWRTASSAALLALLGSVGVAQEDRPQRPPQEKPKEQPQQPPADPATPTQQVKAAQIGELAPAIALKDLDDKEHTLAALKGKVVVLEWFNPDCPVVQMHYKARTFETLRKKYKDLEVVFLAIHSAPAATQNRAQERSRTVVAEWKLPDVLLLDRDGKVAKSYGVKVTPEMCVIDREGRLAYRGAIDDGSAEAVGKVNHVDAAIAELLAKKKVALPETPAYGCPIQF